MNYFYSFSVKYFKSRPTEPLYLSFIVPVTYECCPEYVKSNFTLSIVYFKSKIHYHTMYKRPRLKRFKPINDYVIFLYQVFQKHGHLLNLCTYIIPQELHPNCRILTFKFI